MGNKQKRPHLTQRGVFRSDKYPWCKPGFLALKFTDPMAQDLIDEYAVRRAVIDQEFTDDVFTALHNVGYVDESAEGIITRFFDRLVSIIHWRPSQSVA